MNEATPAPHPARILVALDASPQSLRALRVSLELAALLEAEVEGIFVEDINLLRLCGFPFCQEIGSYTGSVRRVDPRSIEAQLRARAVYIQHSVTTITAQSTVHWSFHVSRGAVVDELLTASAGATLLSVGRAGQLRRKTLGSTAHALVRQSRQPLLILGESGGLQPPLTAVYTGTPAADRALVWLAELARRSAQPVHVLLFAPPAHAHNAAELEAQARARLGDLPVKFTHVRYGNILGTLHAHDGGTLVLPSEQADLVAEHPGPTVIVP
jgi:nucleotide-binding universal stress UspA family protein